MTAQKDALRLPSRTPAYVSRETGAAELGISPNTWDKWVREGTLPPAAPGFPDSTPRWRWADVDAKLARLVNHQGKDDAATEHPESNAIDLGVAGAQFLRDGPASRSKHRTS